MLLEPQDAELFFKLHRTLMFFVNQRLRVVSGDIATPEEFSGLSPEVRLKVRDAFLDHLDLIQSFVDQNPAHLSKDELDIDGSGVRRFLNESFKESKARYGIVSTLPSSDKPMVPTKAPKAKPLKIGPERGHC
jgi:hypothetical protein